MRFIRTSRCRESPRALLTCGACWRGWGTRAGADGIDAKKLKNQLKLEPRARVELATCRLRIGCSTTELPRRDLFTIASEMGFRNSGAIWRFVVINPENHGKPVFSAGKRVHQPA